MASEKEYRPHMLDFLVAALNEHDRELTALGDSLKESIQLLNTERFVEKYESIIDRQPAIENFPEKMDNVVTGFWALENRMQRVESDSLKLKVSGRLSRTHVKTYQVLSEEKGMTASEVAGLTRRSRAMETVYLNQLVELGFVEKLKKGRKYYYARVPIRQTAYLPSSSIHGKVMIVVMVSEQMSEDSREIQEAVSHRLSDLENWKIEKSTILSR